MRTAEVVVIGAGVIGASVAHHLASRGVGDVVVVERAPRPGLGSTACATGGFRAQFTTEVNVRLSLLSRAKLLAFGDEIGVDPGYRPYGYLFMATSHEQLDLLQAAIRVQRRAGLREVAEVSAARLGVEFVYAAGDARCIVANERVTAVQMDRITISTRCVVNAAGPWAELVARDAGVDIPVPPSAGRSRSHSRLAISPNRCR
jgi:sarcosine oxidase subunit beta